MSKIRRRVGSKKHYIMNPLENQLQSEAKEINLIYKLTLIALKRGDELTVRGAVIQMTQKADAMADKVDNAPSLIIEQVKVSNINGEMVSVALYLSQIYYFLAKATQALQG